MRKKNSRLTTVLLAVVFLVGLSVMLYPTVSDLWNKHLQGKAVAEYQQTVSDLDNSDIEAMFARAHEYNRELASIASPLTNYDEVEGYDDILNVTGTGIMGYISIPQIRVELPIYHGTNDDVLNVAVGHLQGSSLPVGGVGTHAVISAHRGLPSAKLFTDLDKLTEGDRFTVTVLNKTCTYEVEQIFIILPEESQYLAIRQGRDLLTLTTCTPYGINTHRLLVRAHRVFTDGAASDVEEYTVSADAVQIDSMNVVPFIAAVPTALLLGKWLFGGKKKRFPHKHPLSALYGDDKENKQT